MAGFLLVIDITKWSFIAKLLCVQFSTVFGLSELHLICTKDWSCASMNTLKVDGGKSNRKCFGSHTFSSCRDFLCFHRPCCCNFISMFIVDFHLFSILFKTYDFANLELCLRPRGHHLSKTIRELGCFQLCTVHLSLLSTMIQQSCWLVSPFSSLFPFHWVFMHYVFFPSIFGKFWLAESGGSG